jgi:adenosylmethionine-8-amino-7-oxononanoate aminotransferase
VRTIGLLGGVELDAATRTQVPDLAERVVRRAREQGVLTRNLLGRTLQISPPFVITESEIRQLGEVLGGALEDIRASV